MPDRPTIDASDASDVSEARDAPGTSAPLRDALGRPDYFEAGMDLLGTGGVGAVTIARLCEALGVTKGSFYHHFRNVEDFRHQLLTHWSSERERQVLHAAAQVADPAQRLDVLRSFAVALHHEAEVAIRAWSRTDADAWAVREKVDAARERAIAGAYRDVGVPDDLADELGRAAVALLIGAQHRTRTTDRAGLDALFHRLHQFAIATHAPAPAPT